MMLKKTIILIGVILILASCYKLKQPKKPKNLISKKEMVNILIDLRLISSANGTNREKLDSLNIETETYIYNKYHIDSLQFVESNNYYAFHMDDYEEIYNNVKDSLDKLSNFYKELEKEEAAENKKQDSLKLIPKDALTEKIMNKKLESGLIAPVSDTELPLQ